MESSKQTILCVDDDKDSLELITFLFEVEGYEVTACNSLEDCLEQVRNNHFTAIILDNRFGNESSLEACDEIRSHNPDTPIVFYSGEARQAEVDKAMEECADVYLVKPTGFDVLTETVKKLILEAQAQAPN